MVIEKEGDGVGWEEDETGRRMHKERRGVGVDRSGLGREQEEKGRVEKEREAREEGNQCCCIEGINEQESPA